MDKDRVALVKKENIGTVILDHIEKGNSLTPGMLNRLEEIFTDLGKDDSIRTVVICGKGEKAFCAGYDISALPVQSETKALEKLKDKNPLETALKSIEAYPYPVIAMMNGYAFGAGCELALACDFRIGADDIKVGMPPAKIGIVYAASGLQRFIQTIGLRYTREMFFTGKPYSGAKLLAAGILDYQLPRSQLVSFTCEFAAGISENAPLALKGTKKIIGLLMQKGRLADEENNIAEALAGQAFQSDDLKEGQMAFFEKRKPFFTGG